MRAGEPAAPSSRELGTRGRRSRVSLADGLFAFEGDDADSSIATRMKGIRPYVEWDLGAVTHVSAATAQLDNNDAYRLTGSTDGESYTALWIDSDDSSIADSGNGARGDLNADVRFVRLEALAGDKVFAASEVQVFKVRFPSRGHRRRWFATTGCPCPEPTSRRASTAGRSSPASPHSGSCSWCCRGSVVARRAEPCSRAVLLCSALVWSNIGSIQGCASVHYWDVYHYFMGTKYFPELGYFELYRCVATSEREAGRGEDVDHRSIRDLEDGLLYPGDSTRTSEGGCRARPRFSHRTMAGISLGSRDFSGNVSVAPSPTPSATTGSTRPH